LGLIIARADDASRRRLGFRPSTAGAKSSCVHTRSGQGDWLRDLGTLRQVEAVDESPSVLGSGRFFVVRFVSAPGVEDLVLSIPGTVTVIIWRLA
jgi:hypothetical protein